MATLKGAGHLTGDSFKLPSPPRELLTLRPSVFAGVPMSVSEKGWGPYAATLFATIAGAYGGCIGEIVGGPAGAILGASIVGMAIVLVTATKVSPTTAARAAAAFSIAASIGYVTPEVPHIPADVDFGNIQQWREVIHRCGAAASNGAVQIALPAIFLGIVLTGQSVGRFGPLLFSMLLLGAWWGSSRLFALLPSAVQTSLADFTLKPLPEPGNASPLTSWFASLTVLTALFIWVRFIQGNRVAFRLGLCGMAAGGLAFSLSEAFREATAWLPASITAGTLGDSLTFLRAEPFQSMICGAAWSGILGGGAWRTRTAFASTPDIGTLRLPWEVGLLVIHATILMASLFVPQPPSGGLLATYGQVGLIAAALPLACCLTGKRVPWLLLLPGAAAPMIGLTLHHAVHESRSLTVDMGWLLIVAIPLAILSISAMWAISYEEDTAGERTPVSLIRSFLVCIGISLGLATVMLDFSWPWLSATPHALALAALMGFAATLTLTVIRGSSRVTASDRL